MFLARISEAVPAGTDLAFPVVQTCANGSESWTEIAAPGQDAHALKKPAPTIRVAAAEAAPKAYTVGAITVEQPWSRATPAGAKVGGGYLRVTNAGREPDRLIGGTFPIAGRVELHEMSMTDNVMRMKQVEGGLAIGPGASVELRPGGYHLMFVDLRDGLKRGQTIKGTLVFEKAGPVEIEYVVRAMSGEAALRPPRIIEPQERAMILKRSLLLPLSVFLAAALALLGTLLYVMPERSWAPPACRSAGLSRSPRRTASGCRATA